MTEETQREEHGGCERMHERTVERKQETNGRDKITCSKSLALPRRPLIRPEDPLKIGLILLDRSLSDLVRCAGGRRGESGQCLHPQSIGGERRRARTLHVKPRADLGELDGLVRRLEEDVMPVECPTR